MKSSEALNASNRHSDQNLNIYDGKSTKGRLSVMFWENSLTKITHGQMITPGNIILTRTNIWEEVLDKNDAPLGFTSFHHIIKHTIKPDKDRKLLKC